MAMFTVELTDLERRYIKSSLCSRLFQLRETGETKEHPYVEERYTELIEKFTKRD